MERWNPFVTKPTIIVQTESEKIQLEEADGCYSHEDLAIRLVQRDDGLRVEVTADHTPLFRVWLCWNVLLSDGVKILGDAWERGYGDLEWRGIVPQRVMPWYVLIHQDGCTHGCGVKTGAGSMCSWKVDNTQLRLCLDVRNGGCGVILKGRTLHAATIVAREGNAQESAFEAAKALCRLMCDQPRLPREMVYGSNNWYYAYGNSSAGQIMQDAALLAELTEGLSPRPYMVIDDGWQISHSDACTGGPWNSGNYRFPDMAKLAQDIKSLDLHPGIWFRPLTTYECYPWECYMPHKSDGAHVIDPSHPYVLERIEEMTRGIAKWGYELIKHDFSTYDIFGRWGFDMGDQMTDSGWHFYDQSKTTAEIILDLYRAIRRGAGENTVIIGCNTVSHLAAGLFELQRTGDDTSGVEWERTRKMGVNTLAFRMPQNGTFYAADADCLGITGKIDWALNREWLELLTVSGTPMFISADPAAVTPEQRTSLKQAYQRYVQIQQEAVPLDWLSTTCPCRWETAEGTRTFHFPCMD